MRNIYAAVTYVGTPNVTRTFSLVPDSTGEGRLLAPLKFRVSVRTWVQKERTSTSISDITLCNADGELDGFEDNEFVDVEISEDIDGTTTQLAYAKIERGLVNGEKTLTLKLKPTSEDLDTPLQTNLYPASELSDTGSGTITYYAVEDQPRPLGYGTIRNAEGMLVQRSTNEYHLHDEDAFSILGVYDRGVSVSYTHHNKGFTLAADPDGRVVADFRGQETADNSSFLKNINEIIPDIMSRMSVTAYSTSDLNTINTDLGYNYNYYQDNKVNRTAKEVVQWLCNSHTGWFYTDADGDIRFGYLQEPAVTADVEVNQYQITDEVDKVDDLAPNITARLGGNRNWFVYHADDMAASATDENVMDRTTQWQDVVTGVNTLDNFYNEANVIQDTLIQNTTKIQDEADRVTDLYSEKRAFYFFSTTVNAEIGETVEVTHPRHGLSAGVNLLCVGREIDFINNTYRLTLWG